MSKKVVILGGGYAGVNAALRLRLRNKSVVITLVNEKSVFIERIRNHQAAAGTPLRQIDLQTALGKTITLKLGRADKIDTVSRQVWLKNAGGREALDYDFLVYALGSGAGQSEGARRQGNPPVYRINTREESEVLRASLAQRQDAEVVVVGAGLTGLELATELRENYPARKITLADRSVPGSRLSAKAQDYLNQTLAGMHIGFEMMQAETLADADFMRGEKIVVNCTGFTSPDLARLSGLACDEKNRVYVNEILQVPEHPEIFVAGDAAAYGFGTEGVPHSGCAAAMPMGSYTGEALATLLRGRKPAPFRFGFPGFCISLGRRRGLIQLVNRHTGVPTERIMTGRTAAFVKELICKMTVAVPAWERKTRWPIYTWLKTRPGKRGIRIVQKAA